MGEKSNHTSVWVVEEMSEKYKRQWIPYQNHFFANVKRKAKKYHSAHDREWCLHHLHQKQE
ncbi:hypothetical protein SESBI_37370 [Sesbania bispinosa]|nr:hypothetical protein SESBI_37370 [Sesbania bispinosa]